MIGPSEIQTLRIQILNSESLIRPFESLLGYSESHIRPFESFIGPSESMVGSSEIPINPFEILILDTLRTISGHLTA